jgi:hypothetical protein
LKFGRQSLWKCGYLNGRERETKGHEKCDDSGDICILRVYDPLFYHSAGSGRAGGLACARPTDRDSKPDCGFTVNDLRRRLGIPEITSQVGSDKVRCEEDNWRYLQTVRTNRQLATIRSVFVKKNNPRPPDVLATDHQSQFNIPHRKSSSSR